MPTLRLRNPSLDCLIAATTDVAAFYVDDKFYPNSGDNLVDTIREDMAGDDPVLSAGIETDGDVEITKDDLLNSVIVDSSRALRLADGRKIRIVPNQPATFLPDASRR